MIRHIVCMGVSGSGKSTIGQKLADRLGVRFAEGDDFHTQANRDRMANGIPLTDEDRAPWLASIRDWMTDQAGQGQSTVVACSALKRSYRNVLRGSEGLVLFVNIYPPYDLLKERLTARRGHFMGVEQLNDQLNTLEGLETDEEGVTVTNQASADTAVDDVMAWLSRTFH